MSLLLVFFVAAIFVVVVLLCFVICHIRCLIAVLICSFLAQYYLVGEKRDWLLFVSLFYGLTTVCNDLFACPSDCICRL